jgi:hypothetical protein
LLRRRRIVDEEGKGVDGRMCGLGDGGGSRRKLGKSSVGEDKKASGRPVESYI